MDATLVIAAHGTRSDPGVASLRSLASLVRAQRPGLSVALCYLDVLAPRLPSLLDEMDGPVVVVPALLSTGYHVADDIPSSAAAHPLVRVAAHLGPHPLLTVALRDRLGVCGDPGAGPVALMASGSSRPGALLELHSAAAHLAGALGRPVLPVTVADPVPAGAVAVATYLLAEGWFASQVRSRAAAAGVPASAPLGAHPAVAELILARYDEATG